MKCSIIISDGVKQVMFTPENDSEKQALKMITVDDDIQVVARSGSFTSKHPLGFNVEMCKGGFLRAWVDDNSVMLVLTPKATQSPNSSASASEGS